MPKSKDFDNRMNIIVRIFVTLLFAAGLYCCTLAVYADVGEISSGSCGKNGSDVTFMWNGIDTVFVEGNGAMCDYDSMSYDDQNTFYNIGSDNIKRIVIGDGITEIGDDFFTWTGVESLVIGSSVEKIGDRAFYACQLLDDVTIPDNVKTIGENAFACCDLEHLDLGNGIQNIDDSAFSTCYIKNLIIPESVKNIGPHAFSYCRNLNRVILPSTLETINFSRGDLGLKHPFDGSCIDRLVLSNGIKNVPELLMAGVELKYVEMPLSVKHIGREAFGNWHFYDDNYNDESGIRNFQPVIYYAGSRDQFLSIVMDYTLMKFFFLGDDYYYGYDTDFEKGGPNYYTQKMTDGVNCVEIVCDNSIENPEEDPYMITKAGPYSANDCYGFKTLTDPIKKKIYERFFTKSQAWGLVYNDDASTGACYGMALTAMCSVALDSPTPKSYGKQSLYDVEPNTTSNVTRISALKYIHYAHAFQYTPENAHSLTLNYGNMSGLYRAVLDYANGKTNRPVLIRIATKKGDEIEGHFLWGLGISSATADYVGISVYDSNYPGQFREMYLYKDEGTFTSWEYEFENNVYWRGNHANDMLYELTYSNVSAGAFLQRFNQDETIDTEDDVLVTIDVPDYLIKEYQEWYDENARKHKVPEKILFWERVEDQIRAILWYDATANALDLNDLPAGIKITYATTSDAVSVKLTKKADIHITGIKQLGTITINADEKASFELNYYGTETDNQEVSIIELEGTGKNISISKQTTEDGKELVVTGIEGGMSGSYAKGAEDEDGNLINPVTKGFGYGNMEPDDTIKVDIPDSKDNHDNQNNEQDNEKTNQQADELPLSKRINILEADYYISSRKMEWTGSPLKPTIVIIDKNRQSYRLKENIDYTLEYECNTDVGQGILHYKGIGRYKNGKYVFFDIVPKGTKIKKVKRKGKKATIKWEKQPKQITGYQIQYSTNKNFKKNVKTKTIQGPNKTSKKIKGLKKKKKYYVRIRTYTIGTKYTFYSSWSKTKKIR